MHFVLDVNSGNPVDKIGFIWAGPPMVKLENLLKFFTFIHNILSSRFDAVCR